MEDVTGFLSDTGAPPISWLCIDASAITDIDYTGASGAVDVETNGNVKSGFIVWEAYRLPTKTVDFKTVGRFTLEELLTQLK